jgi:hypothetical protein
MSVTLKVPVASERSWRHTLQAKPVRNTAADTQREDDGRLRITVHSRKPWFLVPPFSWVIRPRFTKHYTLDRVGGGVWDLCDGTRAVEQIVESFAATQGLTFHEARASVTGYLRELVRRGALAVAV